MHDEFAKQAIGSIWESEWKVDVGDALFLVVDVSWEKDWLELKVLNLFTGELQCCPFDSGQRKGPNHWAIFYTFPRRGLWSLIEVDL
jgi:hypothetical protein